MLRTSSVLTAVLQVALVGILLLGLDQVLSLYKTGQYDGLQQHSAALRSRLQALEAARTSQTLQLARLRRRIDQLTAQQHRDAKELQTLQNSAGAAKNENPLALGEDADEEGPLPPAAAQQLQQAPAGTPLTAPLKRNRVVMDGPYCQRLPAASAASGSKLPIFLFVAGVEGSGHHALLSVWEAMVKGGIAMELVVFDQKFHALGIENHASYHYSSIELERHRQAMAPLFESAAKSNSIVVDAQNSYPMGAYAGSLAHPDLAFLQALDGTLFDLRVIVLYRNPTDAVMSAVRRFRDDSHSRYKTAEFQARMVSESLVNINNNMARSGCGKWMVLRFEDFARNPRSFIGPLARLLSLPKSKLEQAFGQVRVPASRGDSPEIQKQRKVLDDFFRRQKVLWPLLASAIEAK